MTKPIIKQVNKHGEVVLDGLGAAARIGSVDAAADAGQWWVAQQLALEQALEQFPASDGKRWEKIANAVPGKTKGECVARFKQIVAALKAKKAAAAAAK